MPIVRRMMFGTQSHRLGQLPCPRFVGGRRGRQIQLARRARVAVLPTAGCHVCTMCPVDKAQKAVDNRPVCRSTIDGFALVEATAALGDLGLSSHEPAATDLTSAWCEPPTGEMRSGRPPNWGLAVRSHVGCSGGQSA